MDEAHGLTRCTSAERDFGVGPQRGSTTASGCRTTATSSSSWPTSRSAASTLTGSPGRPSAASPRCVSVPCAHVRTPKGPDRAGLARPGCPPERCAAVGRAVRDAQRRQLRVRAGRRDVLFGRLDLRVAPVPRQHRTDLHRDAHQPRERRRRPPAWRGPFLDWPTRGLTRWGWPAGVGPRTLGWPAPSSPRTLGWPAWAGPRTLGWPTPRARVLTPRRMRVPRAPGVHERVRPRDAPQLSRLFQHLAALVRPVPSALLR